MLPFRYVSDFLNARLSESRFKDDDEPEESSAEE